jgi:antitoxin HigA-1
MAKRESDRLTNIHPGEVLLEEFLKPFGISAYRLAQDTHVPQTRISEICHGRRRITADTAIRFSKYFGISAVFWIGLQTDYDLEECRREIETDIELIPTFQASQFSPAPDGLCESRPGK